MPAATTKSPPGPRLMRIERVVKESSFASDVYDAACSHLRILLSPGSFKFSTITQSALQQLAGLGGMRIFSDAPESRGGDRGGREVTPCAPSRRTIGRSTMEQIRRSAADRWMLKADRAYVGNWAVMVRRGAGSASQPRYLTVCGFFECDGRKTHGLGPERLVKHMNLCTYARESFGSDYMYLCTGTFVAGIKEPDGKVRVLVNARSGTWAMAKRFLAISGDIPADDAEDAALDADAVRFAAPRVTRILRRLLSGRRQAAPRQ